MAREQVGPEAVSGDDAADVSFVDSRLATFVGNTVLVEPHEDYELVPPNYPVNGQLVLFEIRPTAQIVVSIPGTCRLTAGTDAPFMVPEGKSAFLGIRWSEAASAWYVLALTVEV